MKNQVVWFDIPVRDLDRAIKFYAVVLGSEIEERTFPGGAIGVLPHGGDGVGGCLVVTEDNQPSNQGPLLYLNVDGRLDEALATVAAHGGKVLQPRHAIGENGHRAIIEDSEGNRLALHSD